MRGRAIQIDVYFALLYGRYKYLVEYNFIDLWQAIGWIINAYIVKYVYKIQNYNNSHTVMLNVNRQKPVKFVYGIYGLKSF